ncbi:MAG TPA: hypothetical protein DCF84_06250 [Bacteroidetes bacterium]|nr:hypothetical protein [Bacteroidota bacterium]
MKYSKSGLNIDNLCKFNMAKIIVCMFRKKAISESRVIKIAEHELRLYVIRERRSNQRFGLSTKGLIVRVPIMTSTYELNRILDDAFHWAEKALKLKPLHPINFRKLKADDRLYFFDGVRIVKFSGKPTTSDSVPWKAGLINEQILQIKGQEPVTFKEHEMVSKAVRKAVKNHYRNILQERVRQWNNHLELGEVNGFRLGYTTSRWGSCQHNTGKIALSTRLTLCPLWVIDAVIVHELCHLVHNNHSKAFWALLDEKYPRYREADRWVKENGTKCIL